MDSDLITALVAALSSTAFLKGAAIAAGAGAAASGIAKTVQKAVQGEWPWDDPLGHIKDITIDSTPIAGPLIETATEGGDWGSAGISSGLNLASIVGGGLGAAAGMDAAMNVGTEAAKSGAAGAAQSGVTSAVSPATQSLVEGIVPEAVKKVAETATSVPILGDVVSAAGNMIPGVGAYNSAFNQFSGIASDLAGNAARDALATGAMAAPASAAPDFLSQAYSTVRGPVADLARNTLAGSAGGAIADYENPARGALAGAAGGFASTGVQVAGQELLPPLLGGQGPQYTPTDGGGLMSPWDNSPQAQLSLVEARAGNSWRALGNYGLQKTMQLGQSAAADLAQTPVARALTPPLPGPRPVDETADPYGYYRQLPGMMRRRLV
jgi:hypothetical protein